MNQISAYYLSLNPDADAMKQWDTGFIEAFLNGTLWQPSNWAGFDVCNAPTLPKKDVAVVVIPARHHKNMENLVNMELAKIGRVVLFLVGDEEAEFNVDLIDHPNIQIWVQNPHLGIHDKYNRLGTGFPKHAPAILKKLSPPVEKPVDIYFAGQVTHQRRVELVSALERLKNKGAYNIIVEPSAGFTQGLPPEQYYAEMLKAKFAPAPSGAVIPDSFRLFEALECMAIPIADQRTADGQVMEYWDWLFGRITPFPKLNNWDILAGLIPQELEDYDSKLHAITCWWINYKRDFAYKVLEFLND